jgi:hypothetical protein
MNPKILGNPLVAWRDDRTLQIGWGLHSVVVRGAASGLPRWLEACNGSRPRESLLQMAGQFGIPAEQAAAVIDQLRQAGLMAHRPSLEVAIHSAGLMDEPLRRALDAAGVRVVAAADILVLPLGQIPTLMGAPKWRRRLLPLWLPVSAVHVGPVLDETRGPCPRCVDRTWMDSDPDWQTVVSQAGSMPTWTDPAQLTLAAGAIAHIAAAENTVGLEMIFDPAEPGPRWRVWHAHPRCECQTPASSPHPSLAGRAV